MRFYIEKTFTVSCAHQLTTVPPGHKCGRLHGHTYSITVKLSSNSLGEDGFVVDFGEVKDTLHGLLDHQNLNEVFSMNGYHQPTTAEHLCLFCMDVLDRLVLRRINAGNEGKDWVVIEEISIQEGEGGGIASIRRDVK